MLSLAICFVAFAFVTCDGQSQTQTCSEVMEIPNTPQTITRPLADKPVSTPCNFRVTSLNDNRIKLVFSDLNNMKSSNSDCNDTYVKFADDENGLASATPYCATKQAPQFITKGNQLVIQYLIKNSSNNNFTAQLTPIIVKMPCGTFPENFDGPEQIFTFPAPNQTVEVELECTYKTKSRTGAPLTATISDIKLGENGNCTNDYVVFGSSANLTPNTDYTKCGKTVPQDSYTSTAVSYTHLWAICR
ncbi:hypothetical protein FGIG_07991 [Fasciola gigantica]|uniref:CUB domain-containing protein n=1 Tax=Fasciola gigantica TaxID=46835 RepID=A0A504YUL5_FASGI|nr:hypothetical protein FGIG_07991 [Fasciola gigantica]